MGKTRSKPLAARHGRGTAWARHGNGMLCVNRPLLYLKQFEERILLNMYGATHGVTTFQVAFHCRFQIMLGYSGPEIKVKFAQRFL